VEGEFGVRGEGTGGRRDVDAEDVCARVEESGADCEADS
jgi:hypothetical protein